MNDSKNNLQPLKEITYQNIFLIEELMESLYSWQQPLELIQLFFNDKKRPVNKKKIIRAYCAQSQIFHVFYSDYIQTLKEIELSLNELKKRRKV
ncbi:hypothetical protein ACYSNR_14890 [Enterococcus sp. LJL128]